MQENLILFETAKLVKEKEFSNGSNICYTEYHSDFIYGEDENHPESHKSKEVRRYNMYNSNTTNSSNENFSSYECPTQATLQKWLREQHGIFIGIDCNCDKYRFHAYNVNVHNDKYPKYRGIEDTYLFEFGTEEFMFNTYEEALEKGLQEALKMI